MQKIRLDVENLTVESFDTAEGQGEDGTVMAHSSSDCESDSGCPSALCTRDLYYPECRWPTQGAFSGCDFSCEFAC